MGEPVPSFDRLGVDAWAALPEDTPGELVRGALVEEEAAGYLHDALCAALLLLIGRWLDGRGRLATSDARFAVAADKGRKPDLSVYFERVKLPAQGAIRIPPDVVVEVVSPTPADRRRDRIEKLGEYAGFGVRFYWLVDPELETFEVLELEGGSIASPWRRAGGGFGSPDARASRSTSTRCGPRSAIWSESAAARSGGPLSSCPTFSRRSDHPPRYGEDLRGLTTLVEAHRLKSRSTVQSSRTP